MISIVTMAAMKYELKMDQGKEPHVAEGATRRGGPAGPPPTTSIFNPQRAPSNSNSNMPSKPHELRFQIFILFVN